LDFRFWIKKIQSKIGNRSIELTTKSKIENGARMPVLSTVEAKGWEAPLVAEEIQRGLVSNRLGKKIHSFAEIASTNLHAYQRAQEGGAEGEVFIAEAQTNGKGRMGRSWVSPPYLNLYLSVILRPELRPDQAPQMTLMAAVAVAETIQSFLGFAPEIKWPNDILVKGKKLSGILAESSAEPTRLFFVVLGIGVNLNYPRERMPEAIRESATSLMILTQKPVDRSLFARELIQDLDRWYGEFESQGFAAIRQRWESFFGLRGKGVRVETPDQRIFGKALGIDHDGALILEGEGGSLTRIVAGDVVPLEP
jgi:BirA family biotin operon repressor/biotin-[acetyl-CoA-carboxylase] ligase